MNGLTDAKCFASSGLAASATQTLYPRHAFNIFPLFLYSLLEPLRFSRHFRYFLFNLPRAARFHLKMCPRLSWELFFSSSEFKKLETAPEKKLEKFKCLLASLRYSQAELYEKFLWVSRYFSTNFLPRFTIRFESLRTFGLPKKRQFTQVTDNIQVFIPLSWKSRRFPQSRNSTANALIIIFNSRSQFLGKLSVISSRITQTNNHF